MRKLIEAVPERNEHQEDLQEFENSLNARYATQLAQWKMDIEAWKNDMAQPNPFEVKSECLSLPLHHICTLFSAPFTAITQASIRFQLAKDEAEEASKTLTPPIHADISLSILISTGIDLEEQQ